MKNKDFISISMFLFLVIGAMHLYRIVNKFPVTFGDSIIPLWASWIAAAVGLYLAYQAYKLRS